MIVELNPSEVLVCECIGRMRSLIARSAHIEDRKIGNQNGSDADVMGIKVEYAFAKQFNIFPDLGLSPRSGSYDGILKGVAYDIKSTHVKSGHLLATRKVNPDVDMYVLCVVTKNQVDIKGYIFKKDFIKPENLKRFGNATHESYCVAQSALTPFKEKT